jgi:arylsulfatase
LIASAPLSPGKAHIVLNLTPNQENADDSVPFGLHGPVPAVGQLSINGAPQGQAQFTNVALNFSETLDVGSDLGSPVSPDYNSPNRFTGKIDKVTIELK